MEYLQTGLKKAGMACYVIVYDIYIYIYSCLLEPSLEILHAGLKKAGMACYVIVYDIYIYIFLPS